MRAVAQALAAQLAAVVIAALLWQREITSDQAFDVSPGRSPAWAWG